MARYYEGDTLIEFVKNNTPHINGETTLACVERAIHKAPTADVVPKSEVDELQAKIAELKKDRYCISPDGGIKLLPRSDVDKIKSENERLERILNSYTLQYGTVKDQQEVIDKAKAEVAREIFEEIDRIIDEKYNRFVFKDQPYDSDEEIDAIINYSDSVSDAITGLKKKYTEGNDANS